MDRKNPSPDPISLPERSRSSRRRLLIASAILSFPVALWWFLPASSWSGSCQHSSPQTPDQLIDNILLDTPLIDTHIDLPISIRVGFNNHIYDSNFTFSEKLPQHVDLPRLRSGQLGGVFWSVYMPCVPEDADKPLNQRFDDPLYFKSIHDTMQQIDLVHRLIDAYPENLALATSSKAVRKVHRTWKHKHGAYGADHPRSVASVIGVEGLHQIGNSPAVMRLYHRLGVRYITLTHMCNNRYADGALAPDGSVWGGLSPAGRDMIREMNRIGMLVDLSHTTADTMKDVLEVAKAPVIFSHSGAYAICPHERNVPDDVLELVKKNGGVVQMVFAPDFVRCGEGKKAEDASLDDVVEHILHIAELIGWEHVGIGSDYDGIESTPKGLEDVSTYPDLLKKLLERGVKENELKLLVGENLLRVWEEAEKVAEEMQESGEKVLEDDVKWSWP